MPSIQDRLTDSQKRMLICGHRDKSTPQGSLWVYEPEIPKRTRIRAAGEEFKREAAHADLQCLQESGLVTTFESPFVFGGVQVFLTDRGGNVAEHEERTWAVEAKHLSRSAQSVLLEARRLQESTKKTVAIEPYPAGNCILVEEKEVPASDPNALANDLENRSFLEFYGLTTNKGGSGKYCLTPKAMTLAETLDRAEVSQ